MILWLILFVLSSVIIFFSTKKFLKEEGFQHFLWMIAIALVVTSVISFLISACAPKQFKPNEEIMFCHIDCDSIIITPALFSQNSINTSKFNMDYKLQNNTATLSEEIIPVYCCSFETSTIGHPYIEKYFCERISPIREFLYGSWHRPRWYYKIYLVPTE